MVKTKIIFILFLVFLLESLGSAYDDDKNILEEIYFSEFDDFDDVYNEDEDEIFDVWRNNGRGNKNLVNVDTCGAAGDGTTDDTKAFEDAWKQACSTRRSVFMVPSGRTYLINATKFDGPCANGLTIQVDGTIVAPSDPEDWDPKSPKAWLVFSNLTAVTFQGNGIIDGSGTYNEKINLELQALTIDSSSRIRVKGLTFQNSQQMHFVISRSDSVRVNGVKVSSPGDSPNTDGIHLSESTNVVLQDCKIGTGDDCISIVNASSNIKMKSIYCGPGHGISIGSLGKDDSIGIVNRVVLDTAFLKGTSNGLRIKTWQGGSGYVRTVRFQNVQMDDVSNPIIIDQFYCDSQKPCQNQTSAVEISEVLYRNVTGTSKSQKAMKFACSDTVPCRDITLDNVNLVARDGTAEVYCNSATGVIAGYVHPEAESTGRSFLQVAATEEAVAPPLRVVQIEGLFSEVNSVLQVILKIIKHCQEFSPALVTGQLLGLDVGSVLEVTNCFPFPAREEDEEIEAEGANYQLEMMRCLREVWEMGRVDLSAIVIPMPRLYQSTLFGSFQTVELIETFMNYQENIKRCVCIIYDPSRSNQGVLALKALKLSDSFMELYKSNNFTGEKLREKNLSWVDIFEEIPIKVSNSALISAFMTELEPDTPVTQCDYERLQLSTNPYLERNVEFLIECMDDLSMEQQKFQFYYRNLSRQQAQQQAWLQKRRSENMNRKAAGEEPLPEEDPSNPIFKPLPEPSRLDSFLITNQIANYCNQINGVAGQSFSRLYLMKALHEN
ncbi:Eukaryotic translation initiation factor 3 subunit H [Capsicum annuum]|nr:Eukaryotic translation initiation factor 3 subunit H [Capsicum annuum]KAF3683001.1 Eukaryotic translation initiation factor 3 subunit H [Capsicum annuum]